ncbi:MAG: hypothetical protein ACRCUT_05365, partial [Spirochaetota bacterium]
PPSCSSRPERENAEFPDGGEGIMPLVTYRIHTDNDHLAGVDKNDYTSKENGRPFMKAKAKSSWRGEGSLELIKYPYGDGACFIYFSKTNKLQFQCRIISVKDAAK